MSVCVAVAKNGALSIDLVTSPVSCSYVLDSQASAQVLDITALNTLFSQHFDFDLDFSELLFGGYFLAFVSGHVLGRVISGLRKV
jgi:hypothetical protein